MPIHVASTLAIPSFEKSKWDGLVGLAYTPDFEPENKGMSIIDRL
jgi:hypothetical protein